MNPRFAVYLLVVVTHFVFFPIDEIKWSLFSMPFTHNNFSFFFLHCFVRKFRFQMHIQLLIVPTKHIKHHNCAHLIYFTVSHIRNTHIADICTFSKHTQIDLSYTEKHTQFIFIHHAQFNCTPNFFFLHNPKTIYIYFCYWF